MESGHIQAASGINWADWSRIVEAALDPRHRDAVQKFLAQADLSADIPAALDEKLLAPRRSEGATGEQCAYLFCNLGFASLVTGKRQSAEFAMACGRLAEQLGTDNPDLALRRLFLSAKGSLVVAVLTQQPHLLWYIAAERCTAYLRALDRHMTMLPEESLRSNAMAAYSFAGQFLSRIEKARAVEHYAADVSQLVKAALALAGKLPATLASGMWRNVIPGTDAGILFRRLGAVAEQYLQIDEASNEHARRGLKYIDEIFEQHDRATPDLQRILQIRAGLLLASGRHTEASEQAEALENSPDPSVRNHAFVIKARCKLAAGDPVSAAAYLAQVAPTVDESLETWRATWLGNTGDAYWTDQHDAVSVPEGNQGIWRLQAVAAADSQDMPGFLQMADRSGGFLVDSQIQHRQEWAEHMPEASAVRVGPSKQSIAPPGGADADLMAALDEIFTRLVDGTVLLQVVSTEEGMLTWFVQKQDGKVSFSIAPGRPGQKRLSEARNSWDRAYLRYLRHGSGAAETEADGAAAFTELMNEMRRNWGELLQGLVENGATQLIVIGDDLVDIPLHATRIGPGNEHLIDRVPVTYVPSLLALRAGTGRSSTDESQRQGLAIRSLIDSDLDSADAAADAMAAILETKPCELVPPVDDAFWTDVSDAQVLHIVARMSHNAPWPFESLLGADWLDLSIGQMIGKLDLAQCAIVSNLHCESVLPSVHRAPGLDLAAVFLVAGARSVLASTWVTDDELASAMARLFFGRWVTGQAPSAAFRDALLRLRSERPELADFHWAGMRLVGAP